MVDVKIPEAGESVTEGVLVAWLKREGDLVKPDESLFEVETDKVTLEIPAEVPGRLTRLVAEGETVQVGQVVAQIDTDAAGQPTPSPPQADTPVPPAPPVAPTVNVGDGPPLNAPAGIDAARAKLESTDVPLSPAVRRLVAQHDLSPAQIEGTGRGQRLTKGDVLAHLESKEAAPPPAKPVLATPEKQLPATTVKPKDEGRETRVKMTPLRHRITERLVQVQQEAAIVTTFNEVDMARVMAFRARFKDIFQKKFDVRLGFMSFFVKAVVDAMKTVPAINARIDGDEIVYQHYFDIGVAVGTEKGLVVPVIRDTDKKSFAEIEQTIVDLATRARKRRLTLDEMTGGCFTISNGGVYGSLLSTPILNPPQSGILGLHSIQKRPVVVNDEIVIRPMMYLALSYDHRLVDGSEAVTFLKRVAECI
ncbi:MAG: 2-oxoglutarate dehydrogenase complex dihydrolipoyllysine-residue succinyltransferase, partial [Proteobacteria bacterium]|nr:2-oxoglutarate dehydrogenase complex dihydrolipoyllysine-residue succinyltransferase [Pseudomonadota bacterium]